MSLRTQHDLAELRRERQALASQPIASRLATALRVGIEALRAPPPTASIGIAPRGARLPYERAKWEASRAFRLTASMLPFWVELQGGGRAAQRQDIVRVMAQYGGVWQYEGTDRVVLELMQYGRDHEIDAVLGFMEITRHLVGLGSTRVRGEADLRVEHTESHEGDRRWDWHELVSATPDGFVLDDDDRSRGSLLEAKCPCGGPPFPVPGAPGVTIKRRHAVEQRMRFENDTYLLLQAWMQLVVCSEAEHVFLVYWKRASTAPDAEQYVWLARLSRNNDLMNDVRKALGPEVDAFHHAMMWIRQFTVDEDDSDATEGEGDGPMPGEDVAAMRARWARNGQQWPLAEARSPQELQDRLRTSERAVFAIKGALKAWTDRELRWRDGADVARGFRWTSAKELEEQRRDDGMLCHRYNVRTGAVATHSGAPRAMSGSAEMGYDPIYPPRAPANTSLTAAELWPTERIGFHTE